MSVLNLLGGNVAYGGDLAMARNLLVTGNIIRQSIALRYGNLRDAIRVKQAFNDTIYTISEQGLTPYLVFELGEWH